MSPLSVSRSAADRIGVASHRVSVSANVRAVIGLLGTPVGFLLPVVLLHLVHVAREAGVCVQRGSIALKSGDIAR